MYVCIYIYICMYVCICVYVYMCIYVFIICMIFVLHVCHLKVMTLYLYGVPSSSNPYGCIYSANLLVYQTFKVSSEICPGWCKTLLACLGLWMIWNHEISRARNVWGGLYIQIYPVNRNWRWYVGLFEIWYSKKSNIFVMMFPLNCLFGVV